MRNVIEDTQTDTRFKSINIPKTEGGQIHFYITTVLWSMKFD